MTRMITLTPLKELSTEKAGVSGKEIMKTFGILATAAIVVTGGTYLTAPSITVQTLHPSKSPEGSLATIRIDQPRGIRGTTHSFHPCIPATNTPPKIEDPTLISCTAHGVDLGGGEKTDLTFAAQGPYITPDSSKPEQVTTASGGFHLVPVDLDKLSFMTRLKNTQLRLTNTK